MKQQLLPRGALLVAIVSLFGLIIPPVSSAGNITVTVNVTPPDPNLTYRWRATDGQIIDRNAPSTQWTLPTGPGLHFAYVLVSNGKGGYTERRIQVNTDGLSAVQPRPPMSLIAPPASPSSTVPFRNWLGGGLTSSPQELVAKPANLKVALPDVKVDAITLSGPIISEQSITSLRGDFVLNNFSPQPPPLPLQPVPGLGINCFVGSLEIFRCFGLDASLMPLPDEVFDVQANQTNRIDPVLTQPKITGQEITWFTGSVRLSDLSTCGTENEFFGVTSTATAELVESFTGTPIPGSRVRANSWGQYSIPVTAQMRQQMHLSVVVRCEGADPVTPANSGTMINPPPPPPLGTAGYDDTSSLDFGVVTINSAAPVVTKMSVIPATIPSKFDDPAMAPALPSDIVPLRPAKFLAMKGLDTRLSGCQYYKAIGAVKDCDAEGNFRGGAVSFEDWKRTVKIDQYAPPGTPQYRAVFVNRVDLNLTRDHHSVSNSSTGVTAGYVCNHLGPQPTQADPTSSTQADPTGLFPPQGEIDKRIDNAVAGRDLVACVAMDYSVAPEVNGGMPFTRFLIFGPSGDLLPSVNLDGLGEKFVPGTCTVCHGGNKYAGKFPEDGTGTADLEAHFLPFDIGNFEFSKRPGWPALTQEAQEEAIYQLNQNVLKTKPNNAVIELINGWYMNGNSHTQDTGFAPSNFGADDYYSKVIARNCRTCHIAQRDQDSIKDLNFTDHMANTNSSQKPGAVGRRVDQTGNPVSGTKAGTNQWLRELVCGQTDDLLRAFAMPNSKVTFDLFWLSQDAVRALRSQTGVADCQNPKAPPIPIP